MSSSLEPVLLPPSLWHEATLNEEPANSPATAIIAGSEHHVRAGREAVGRAARTRLPVSRIDPDPRNPRAPTSQEVQDLARSLAAHGLLQPIVVRPVGQRYVVVAGHRRFAAWIRCASEAPSDARWRTIDAVVRDVSAEEALTLMLVENLQRKSLSPLQEAVTLQRLRVERGWSNRQVAEAVQKSEMYVSRRLRVLDDTVLRDAVLDGRLAVTTAEELLAVDVAGRGPLVALALAEGWSPGDARRAVQALGRHSRGASPEERWREQLTGLQRLLDKQAAPPASLRAEITRVAQRLLAYCQA
jgi:ParB/RepB/Spo0J family partition protein